MLSGRGIGINQLEPDTHMRSALGREQREQREDEAQNKEHVDEGEDFSQSYIPFFQFVSTPDKNTRST